MTMAATKARGGWQDEKERGTEAWKRAHHRDVLEAEEAFVAKVVRRVRGADNDDVLDADAVAPVSVISGLCTATGHRLDER